MCDGGAAKLFPNLKSTMVLLETGFLVRKWGKRCAFKKKLHASVRSLRTLRFFLLEYRFLLEIVHNIGKQILQKNFKFVFGFYRYWAALKPTLGHWGEDSLTRPMLITTYIWFDPRIIGSLVTRLSLKVWRSASIRFESGTFRFLSWRATSLSLVRFPFLETD